MIKSAITNSGDQIASKLDKIVDFLQVSNQKVAIISFKNKSCAGENQREKLNLERLLKFRYSEKV